MFNRFGEFDSAEEINTLAVNLRKEGDQESIRTLAEENGIPEEIAECFISGDFMYLCDAMTAAIGKIEIECTELKPEEIMQDWVEYIKEQCFEDEHMAAGVRKKRKSLEGCVGALLKWSIGHQIPVKREIIKASGVNTSRCTLGIPGMGTAKKLIREYYLGKGANK